MASPGMASPSAPGAQGSRAPAPGSCLAWLQELRRVCGLSGAEQGMEWRGESFYWLPASSASPRHVTLHVWVGKVPQGLGADRLLQLLWLQLQSVGPCPPVVGCEPESGHIVIAQALPWEELSAVQALSVMGLLADLAAQCRALLQPDPTAGAAGGGGNRSTVNTNAANTSAANTNAEAGAHVMAAAARPVQRTLPRWWLPQASQA